MLFAEITPLTPLGPKQAEEFLEIENFRVPGNIAVMSSISIYKVPGVLAVKMFVLTFIGVSLKSFFIPV